MPHDIEGFTAVDDWGRVQDLADVYAVGDMTSRPLKQGGLAAQQADVAASAIAASAGAPVAVQPYRPVLSAMLLGGRRRCTCETRRQRTRRRSRPASSPSTSPRTASWRPSTDRTAGMVAPCQRPTTTPAINIVLADDHEVVRAGLRLLLQGEESMHVVGEAGDVPGALRLVETRRPDVLVLDLNMPGPPSLSVIAEVKDKCAVVVLTMQSDPPSPARRCRRARARTCSRRRPAPSS